VKIAIKQLKSGLKEKKLQEFFLLTLKHYQYKLMLKKSFSIKDKTKRLEFALNV